MMPHEHYEQLCTLAAAGQLSRREWVELSEHLETCPDCQGLVHDCGQIGFQVLPLVADDYKKVSAPAGLMERVIARADSAGVLLKEKKSKDRRRASASRVALFGGVALALVLATVVATRYYDSRIHVERRDHPTASTERGVDSRTAGLLAENDRLRKESQNAQEQQRLTAEQLTRDKE